MQMAVAANDNGLFKTNHNDNNDSNKNKHEIYKKLLKFINHSPKMFIYSICLYLFLLNVSMLIRQYLKFETIVMVKYQTPQKIQFPSFTICGCGIKHVVQNDTSTFFEYELDLLRNHTVKEIIEFVSFDSNELIKSCNVIMDSKENMNWNNGNSNNHDKCSIKKIETIYNGRKCFTYLSSLNSYDDHHNNDSDDDHNDTYNEKNDNKFNYNANIDDNNDDDDNEFDNNDRYTAYINIELNYPHYEHTENIDNTLQNANIIFAIHPPNMLPTMLDTEFYRIDPNNLYEIQFTKEVTKLKEKPYRTACKNYEELLKGQRKNAPKSRNECVNLCILEKSLKSQNDSDGEMNCVHYHNVVSRFMLNYHNEELNANNAKFCTSLTYLNYVEFTKIRSNCYEFCNRDCIEENYKTTIDVSTIDDNHKNDPFNPNNHTIMNRTINHHKQQHAKSMIIIWPNREMYQEVEHEGELNFFELIGCLGGHAHIWLGLSIIQFYDVFAKIISCIRYRWELIGDKFRSLRRFCHRKKVHQSSNHSNNNPQ